jgi:hypothetical protein
MGEAVFALVAPPSGVALFWLIRKRPLLVQEAGFWFVDFVCE